MEHTEEAFLNHVKEVFQYELPYRAASWENFQQRNKKKKRVIWLRRSVKAAAVLLLTMLLFWHVNDPVKGRKTALNIRNGVVERHQMGKTIPVVSHAKVIPGRKKIDRPLMKLSVSTDTVLAVEMTMVQVATSLTSSVDTLTKPLRSNSAVKVPSRSSTHSNALIKDADWLAILKKSEDHSAGDWKVNPLISNTYGTSGKLKLGFGASVSYALNEKFAINTGAAYNQLSALRKTGDVNIAGKEGQGKQLQSVQTALSGLDMPIELKYSINSRNYISMGVSAMGILRKSQALNYSELKTVQVDVAFDDHVVTESRVISVEESVPVPGEELPKQNYLGFYNFSYGFSQKIGRKQAFIIEPFVKLPMKPYSNQKTSLTSGGLRLKFEF